MEVVIEEGCLGSPGFPVIKFLQFNSLPQVLQLNPLAIISLDFANSLLRSNILRTLIAYSRLLDFPSFTWGRTSAALH